MPRQESTNLALFPYLSVRNKFINIIRRGVYHIAHESFLIVISKTKKGLFIEVFQHASTPPKYS